MTKTRRYSIEPEPDLGLIGQVAQAHIPTRLENIEAKLAELERRLDKLDRQQPLTLSSWK